MNEQEIEKIVQRVLQKIDARADAPGVRRDAPDGRIFTPDARADAISARWPPASIAIGADHGGVALKEDLSRFLATKNVRVHDCGTHGRESVDYPDFAAAVARRIQDGSVHAGIVIDSIGIGSAIAANKIRGVRCAVCHDVDTVISSRAHNDANVLSLGAKVVPPFLARRMVAAWLGTAFEGDRHLRRVRKIHELES